MNLYPTNLTPEKRLKYLKIFEDFSKKEIPEEVIYICDNVRKDLVNIGNNSYKKLYEFGSYVFEIDLKYTKNDNKSYYSTIDIMKIFDDVLPIPIKVNDINIDIDYLLSIISHELRHLYDILSVVNGSEIIEFEKSRYLEQFKKTKYYAFTYIVYLALEHELIARNNMIYPLFRWSGMKDKPTILTKYKNCEVYKTLDYMSDFDSTYFINKFYTEELLNYTNKFIKDVAKENNFCNTKQDLINYYKIWETFFKNTSIEYKEYGLKEIDKVVNDIRDDKIYEENSNFYGRLYGNKATTIFDNIYKSLFNI